jgi:glycosyltransferase involved in cell wall biosynthesis
VRCSPPESRPLRVLLATELYRPSIGGTERHVELLATALALGGHHPMVVTTSPAGDEHDDPAHVRRITGWSTVAIRRRARPEQHFHPPAADPGVVRALVEAALDHRAEVLHAHGWIAHSAARAARSLGVPLVVTLHDYGLDCARRSRLLDDSSACDGPEPATCRRCAVTSYGPLRGPAVVAGLRRSRTWWPQVSAFIANSDAVAAAAQAAGVDVTVASPFLAPCEPPDERDCPVGLPRGPFVLYVGALSAHKGVDVLTEAWRGSPPAPLVAVVSRPEPKAPPLPPSTIVYRHLDHRAVLATMARAAVTVIPSRFPEPFGLVAAESLWAGTPVVASATGGLPSVLDNGGAGILVPAGDAGALRRAIDDLLHDPRRRVELATAGRARAASLDGTAAVVATYRRVLQGYSQASPAALRT